METREAIKKRRSQRSFLDKPVDKKVIEKLLELANLAPTAMGLQNRNFVVITDPETKEKIADASFKQSHLLKTPVIIAFTTNINIFKQKEFLVGCEKWGTNIFGATPKNYQDNRKFQENWKIWSELWPIQDVDAAITTLMLAAIDEGLSTCWIGLFDIQEVEKILELPKNQKIVSLVCLGYPKSSPSMQNRKPVKELIHDEVW